MIAARRMLDMIPIDQEIAYRFAHLHQIGTVTIRTNRQSITIATHRHPPHHRTTRMILLLRIGSSVEMTTCRRAPRIDRRVANHLEQQQLHA
jgi:hypothetical protein